MRDLAPGRVELWWAPLDAFDQEARASCFALLDESERARLDTFRSESAATQFLAARGLLRRTLSLYRDLAPGQWRFVKNHYGRPFVDPALDAAEIHFSISHTEGMVACAVGSFAEIGVDVEACNREISLLELLPSVLTPQERERFAAISPGERPHSFFSLWTLKEAYVKARGMGLSLPLNGLDFDLGFEPPRACFSAAIDDIAHRWSFRQFRPTSRHVIAVAAGGGNPIEVVPNKAGAFHA